jgi:signal-transduction protein with cAMP-binding, CBS, and nucleotidyltransferase domain
MSIHSLINSTDVRDAKCHQDILLFDAAKKLAELNVNALAVTDDEGAVTGIITDHDIIRVVVKTDDKLHGYKVSEWMTKKVIACELNSELSDAMDLMGRHRIRHLIVVDNGILVGVLGIKDILQKVHENDELEANVLRDIARTSMASIAH